MLKTIVGEVVGEDRKVILGNYCTTYMQKFSLSKIVEGVPQLRLSRTIMHGNLDLMYVTVTETGLKFIDFAATMICYLFVSALPYKCICTEFDFSCNGEALTFNSRGKSKSETP